VLEAVFEADFAENSYGYRPKKHHILLAQVARRINDPKIMTLLKLILKTSGKKGVPQADHYRHFSATFT
jgi:RNA-directed DNA polymerase